MVMLPADGETSFCLKNKKHDTAANDHLIDFHILRVLYSRYMANNLNAKKFIKVSVAVFYS